MKVNVAQAILALEPTAQFAVRQARILAKNIAPFNSWILPQKKIILEFNDKLYLLRNFFYQFFFF